MIAIKAGGSGVITDTHVEWRIEKSFPKYSSPIVVDDLVYFAMDASFVVCVEAKTGKEVWRGRLTGKFRACPIYADGKLFFFSLEARPPSSSRDASQGPRHQPSRRQRPPPSTIPDAVPSWPHPQWSERRCSLRTRHHLYRIESK